MIAAAEPGGDVHDPEAVGRDVVDVDPGSDPPVERLRPIHIRDRYDDDLDLQVHHVSSSVRVDAVRRHGVTVARRTGPSRQGRSLAGTRAPGRPTGEGGSRNARGRTGPEPGREPGRLPGSSDPAGAQRDPHSPIPEESWNAMNDYYLLGRSGLRVSRLALGTMNFGVDGFHAAYGTR